MRISNKLLLVLSSVALLSGCNNKQACPECPQCKQCEACKECKECEECPIPHEHTFSEAWEKDETNHWHKATCEHTELTKDMSNHNFGGDNVCDDCGYVKVVTEMVTVSFNSCGGSEVESIEVEKGKPFIKPNDPTKENYIFMGWFDNADYLGKAYEFGSKVDSNLTLYACWGVEVTLVNYGGANISNKVVRADSKMEAPADPTYQIAHFDGWYENESYTGDKFDFNNEITKNTTLYAKYYYEVTFLDANNNQYSFQKVTLGDKVTLPENPSLDYHNFDGWCIDEKCVYEFDFNNAPTSDLTLYANFAPSKYSIIYNGASKLTHSNPLTYTYGVGLTKLEEPIKVEDGYKFYGWYFDENFEVEATSISGELHETVNVYAKVGEEFNITYKNWPAGDTNPNPTKYTQYDEFEFDVSDVTLPDYIKDVSVKINGEFTNKVNEGTTGDLEIELVFNKKQTKITFNPNNGEAIYDVTIEYGKTLFVTDPVRENHHFIGWYDSQNNKYESGCTWTWLVDDIHLTARYSYDLIGLVVNELINFHETLEEKIDSLEFVSSVDMEDLATDMNKLCLEGNETLLSGNLDKDDAELILNKYKSAIASRFEETSLLNTENGKQYYYNKLQEDVIELINQLKDAGYEDAYINQFSKEKDPIMFEALPAIQSASTLEEAKSIYDDASSEIEIIFSRYI